MKIVIIPNEKKDKDFALTKNVIAELSSLGASVFLDAALPLKDDSVSVFDCFPSDADVIIVIGGDGSILDASHYAVQFGIPILGINLGRLGYLSALAPEEISGLASLLTGDYSVEEKMLLSISIDGVSVSERLAVNEVVFSHSNPIELTHIKMTDRYGASVKYRADGLIFATSVGSTAYSLSAGGPIVDPELESILMTPICPHSLVGRSLVFRPNAVIGVSSAEDVTLCLSADGAEPQKIEPGCRAEISRAEFTADFIRIKSENFIDILYRKLAQRR